MNQASSGRWLEIMKDSLVWGEKKQNETWQSVFETFCFVEVLD